MSDYPQNPNQGQPPPPGPPPGDWSQQPQGQQWGGQQGGFQGQPQYAPQPQANNGLAIGALVCGILGFLGSFIVFGAGLGIIAIILGFIARGKANRGEATGGGMALAGIILGFLSLLIAIAFVALGAALFSAAEGTFTDFVDCVDQAETQAELDACGVEFGQGLGE